MVPQMLHNLDTAPLPALLPAPPASEQSSPASQYSYRGSPWGDLHSEKKKHANIE